MNGQPYQPENPAAGRQAGIAMIYQELNLALHLSIEENILLGIEQSRWGWLRSQKEQIKEIFIYYSEIRSKSSPRFTARNGNSL